LFGETEFRTFSVFEADSSEDAAQKLVINLRMDPDMVPTIADYIEELR
jgi:hypothetical protein